jgi:beta-phosphoglucomutase family hydrolase
MNPGRGPHEDCVPRIPDKVASLLTSDIRALVFDCDGTLADTMPLHYRSWAETLGDYGCSLSEQRFYELGGMPSKQIVETLNREFAVTIPPESAAARKREIFAAMLHDVRPVEPVVEVVRACAGRLPMAVATSGVRASCTRILRHLEIFDFFKDIVTVDDVKNGKPAPDLFLEAAARLGVPPNNCLAFEDADLGIEAARAAGMRVMDVRLLL